MNEPVKQEETVVNADVDRVAGDVLPPGLAKLTHIIDTFTVWTGKGVAWMVLPMIASLVYEVVARYFFNAPTIWAGDISTILYGAFFMLGSAYTLQRQQHIRTDFLYANWSTRTKGIVDSALYITCYFPGLGIFMWISWGYAWKSTLLQERIISSPWMPMIWPLKLCIPLAIALLLIQGVSELIKSLYTAKTGITLFEEVEGVET
ncbi:MAG: TRAP transporter small permease subunit [Deltaproteobacteria bacterium]|nr:TRAP transporter small permease subunit [Deltaproteobacteria bacterium]